MIRLASAVLVLALASVSLTSQSQSSDTIPKELVSLLLRGPGVSSSDNFDIKIGAPENFPRELMPDGAKAAVSTVSERATTVVAELPALTSDDTSAYERKVEAAGWVTQGPMRMRGLVTSTYPTPLMFCQGDRHVTVYLSARPAGGSYARISLTTDARRGCQATPRYSGGPSYFADVTLPNLMPPAGARMTGGGGGSTGSDHYDQRVRMQTELTPEALVTHYADQLVKNGWKLESRAAGSGVAVARLSKMSSINEPIVANLLVNAMSNADLDVVFRLIRVDPNRRLPAGRIGSPGLGGGIVIGGGTCC